MQSAGMFYQLRNQERVHYSDEHIVASILVAYLPQDIPFLMRHVPGGIERSDESDRNGMRKTVEFFVQLRFP
jgi:hypothetical protein